MPLFGATMSQFIALFPVLDLSVKLPGLINEATEQLAEMLDAEGVTLTADPTWTLVGDRLVCSAEARRRAPWDVPPDEAAEAYFLDLLPEPG